MLLQSTEEEIKLLPALPDAWNSGSVKGLKARGGFEVTIVWKNKKVTTASIYSKTGGATTVLFDGREIHSLFFYLIFLLQFFGLQVK